MLRADANLGARFLFPFFKALCPLRGHRRSSGPVGLRVLPERVRPNSRFPRVPRPCWVMGTGKRRHSQGGFNPLHPPLAPALPSSWLPCLLPCQGAPEVAFSTPGVTILGFFWGEMSPLLAPSNLLPPPLRARVVHLPCREFLPILPQNPEPGSCRWNFGGVGSSRLQLAGV